MRALRADGGSILVFLPGQAEIRRTETLLAQRITEQGTDIVALYGALDPQVQDRAIAPSPPGRRKVVLATSIAETSLTIEGVRVVVDSGLARVPRYEPGVGLTRLETVRVSRAAADQRRGRAGRTEPGVCYRLGTEAEIGVARALYAAGNPVRRPVLVRARSGAMGRRRSVGADISRSAAERRHHRSAQAADRTRRARRRRPHHRRRPGIARAAVAAATRAHGGRCRPRRRGRDGRADRGVGRRARSRRQRCRSHAPARSVSTRPLAARG